MINYLIPSSGGGALTYPIEQITVNLTNADLIKLNTSPFEILPQGFYYNVINYTLKYNCITAGTLTMFIGYESLLGINNNQNQGILEPLSFGLSGVFSSNYFCVTAIPQNSKNSEPLVLYSDLDDALNNFTLFELTVTYLKFT